MGGLVNKKQPQVANFSGEKDYIIKGKYRLANYCKGGAFGDVFFAKHTEKGYDVAIKFVSIIFFSTNGLIGTGCTSVNF